MIPIYQNSDYRVIQAVLRYMETVTCSLLLSSLKFPFFCSQLCGETENPLH